MKKLTLFCLICLSAGSVVYQKSASAQNKQPDNIPDKVKATRTIQAYFVGFEMGDYAHAVVRLTNRKRTSFFLGPRIELEYFLAVHKGKLLTLTYHVVDTFLPEAGDVETVERLVSAKVGNENDQNWWQRVSKTSNVGSLRKKYDALVEKVTIK